MKKRNKLGGNILNLKTRIKIAIKNKELGMFTFDQIKDDFIDEIGTEKRTQYEQELQL